MVWTWLLKDISVVSNYIKSDALQDKFKIEPMHAGFQIQLNPK